MTERRAFDASEDTRPASPDMQFTGTMFAAPSHSLTRWASLTELQRKAQRERWQELLLPIVTSLAERRGPEGITASEVIGEGIVAGVLNGERVFMKANPKVYAWVGNWLRGLAHDGPLAKKLVRLEDGGSIHATRLSERAASHSNRNAIYVGKRWAA